MSSRRLLQICAFLLCGLSALQDSCAAETSEKLGQDAAERWVALLDAEKFAESWQGAAGYFQAAITQAQWLSALEAVRKPLGARVSRKFKSATYTKSLPGAPEGEYVLVEFDTSFANMPKAVETITPMLDADKKWKVSGYFIK